MKEQPLVDNVIYTDYEFTKAEINEYAKGWLFHYSNYLMQPNQDNLMGMIKYAIKFITKTKRSYPKFKNINVNEEKDNKFEALELELILNIYDKLVNRIILSKIEFNFINDFIYKYLDITGISDIVREKEDPGSAFGRF